MKLRSVKLKGWILRRGTKMTEEALLQATLENRKRVKRLMFRLAMSEDRLYCAAYAWAGTAALTLGGMGAHNFHVTISGSGRLTDADREAIESASALMAAAGNHDVAGPYELWIRMDADMQVETAYHVLGMAAAAMKMKATDAR